jgi:hypothetical protein
MPMNIDDDRFSPIVTEGSHPRRTNDLEDSPVPYVDGIAGHVNVMSFDAETGLTYHQTEPVGENWHHYTSRNPLETNRPS